MNLEGLQRYILSLQQVYRKKPELDYKLLNILEQFAWNKHVSSYDIYTKLKSPLEKFYQKMAYKNVNKRVHELHLLGLIEKISPKENARINKRKTIYYQLSEYGIYRLFLNRLSSVVVNQAAFRKRQDTSINMLTFFHNYQSSNLFELFIYPYFEKKTLFAIWNFLLFDLCSYLNECSSRIESKLKHSIIQIPMGEEMFSIEMDSDQDDYESIRQYLKNKFNLQDILSVRKTSDKSFLTIFAPATEISIDRNKREATVFSTAKGNYEEFKYSLYPFGSKILAMQKASDEYYDMSDNLRNNMDDIIYRLVCMLANKDSKRSAEFSYYGRILFEDRKFMKTVERIYSNQHKSFEQGYNILRNIG
jgi:hypothetical protein